MIVIKGGETMEKVLDDTWDIPCTTEEKLKVLDILCELDERPSYILEVFLKKYGNKKQNALKEV